MDLAKKLLGGVVAVAGAALLVLGLWFGVHLGGSGTATFDLAPSALPVVVEPSVLNRLDQPTTVRVVPASGQRVWVAVGAPSDVRALLGTSRAEHVTSVKVRIWALVAHLRGTGGAVDPTTAQIWRERHTDTSPVTLTLGQDAAPQTVVVAGRPGSVQRIEVSWTHGAWFAEAVIVALIGLLVLAVGLATVFLHRRPDQAPVESEPTPEVTV